MTDETKPIAPVTATQASTDAKPPSDQDHVGKLGAQATLSDGEATERGVTSKHAPTKYEAGDPRNQTVEVELTVTGSVADTVFAEYSHNGFDGVTGSFNSKELEPWDQEVPTGVKKTYTLTNKGATEMLTKSNYANATKVSEKEDDIENGKSPEAA